MFSFKRHKKQTGLAAVGNGATGSDIKINKMLVGIIVAPSWTSKHSGYKARFMIVTISSDHEPGWKWVTFKQELDSDAKMREWLKTVYEQITEKYDLYSCEPYSD